MHGLATTEQPFRDSSARVMPSGWRIIGGNRPRLSRVPWKLCLCWKIIEIFQGALRAASHSRRSERLDLRRKPLKGGAANSKQCLMAALHCSWSSEPLFIHCHIGIQSASSLFSLITNKLQFLCMCRLKANYLWETGPEKSERPLARKKKMKGEERKKGVGGSRGELSSFYRPLNLPDHSNVCVYYSAFPAGGNAAPVRPQSAPWTL